ncbi:MULTISPECIES: hypothetical protein [Paenibacillus]|uniref:hypothetical protein n=1 Tax=Paenibacillus TaxID=44249 RepID=UPI001F361875|nr:MULTISPECIES: hypothetical protein [Paenibacillus]
MEEISPKCADKESIESLIKKLHLPSLTPFSQDWEYTSADSSRVNEFITFYENNKLNNKEKFTLMIVIISSFDDYLSEGIGTEDIKIWDRIKQNILKDYKLHINTIIYWALEENDLEDCFAVTPYIREILEQKSM